MAADVWIALVTTGSDRVCPRLNWSLPSVSAAVVTGRLSALTMPVVTVPAGRGVADRHDRPPTTRPSRSPIATGVRSFGAPLMVMTARSVDGSVPDLGVERAAVGEGHGELVRTGHDVVVRQHVPGVVDDDPRARRPVPRRSTR